MLPDNGHAASYLQHLRSANYSPNTVYSRGRAIIRFRYAIGHDALDCTSDQLIGWWTALRLSPSSRAGELAAIRGYCKWALRHGIIEADPTLLIDRPRLPRRVPRPICEELLAVAIEAAPDDMLAILVLAGFCGLRACEIAALEWPDVSRVNLLIHGKGSKERVVPIHPIVSDALRRLPQPHRGPVLRRRDGQGGRVPPHLVSQWANRYLHEHGIAETLHQLRHRYGSLTYQLSGGDIRMVQDLMGHASPVTTAGYSAWDVSKAQDVVGRLPLSDWRHSAAVTPP